MSELTPPAPADDQPLPGSPPDPATRRLTLFQMEVTESVFVPPEYVRAYGEIDPELARKAVEHGMRVQEQLIQEWIRQQAHTRELDKERVKQEQKLEAEESKAAIEDLQSGRRLQSRGQWVAAGITLAGFVVVAIALFTNNPTAASVLGGTMVVSLACVFLLGRLLPPNRSTPPPSNDPTE